MYTQTPTKSSADYISHWELASGRKLLTPVDQGFLHGLEPVQHHGALRAEVHGEHRAVDFGELGSGKEGQTLAEEVTV